MPKISPVGHNGNWVFYCPGCKHQHTISSSIWSFNGDVEKPTLSPSVLIKSGHYCSHHVSGDDCWCTFNNKRREEGREGSRFKCSICHSFVTDGKIQFLSDCTHELAGQTVEIPEVE
jgi:hypothetical protein